MAVAGDFMKFASDTHSLSIKFDKIITPLVSIP